MRDVCIQATHPTARLDLAVAMTTATVADAQAAHGLAATSVVALGRLLTGVGLLSVAAKRDGSTSLQVVSQGRIRMLYADATSDGDLRGYAREPSLAFPLSAAERASGRRSVGPAVAPGQLSLIRKDRSGQYTQSATQLVSGEIDLDIAHFIAQSDQVDSVMRCDVLLDDKGRVRRAGGVLVRALPDGNRAHLAMIRDRLATAPLATLLDDESDATSILRRIEPEAETVDTPVPLRWQCRCSVDRVVRSLQLFPLQDLMELIEAADPVDVHCDICGRVYEVPVEEVRRVLEQLIKAQA